MNTIFCDRDCPERNSHCHATCPEYTRKSKKHREDMEKAKLEKDAYRAAGDVQYTGLKKYEKGEALRNERQTY